MLGSFRVKQKLGAGSYATAYLAEQLGTDRCAVIKVPHVHMIASRDGAEVRRRFEAEARAATRVTHPNLVTVYAVGETATGLPAIAMEFVEGETLERRLHRCAPLPSAEVGALGEQLGEALLALHGAGIVHRDLSPSNVVITTRGDGLLAKILDFGVAKRLDVPSRTIGPLGTPGYLAPEQLRGRVTPRADVYSLGAILWWALTGSERADDFHDGSLHAQVNSTHGPNPLALRPEAPPHLARVVSHMLIPHEHARPTTEEFLGEWRSALAGLARRPHGSRRASPSPPPPPPAARAHRPRRTTGRAAPIAVVIADPVLRTLVSNTLATVDQIEVVLCGVREVTRANPGAYSLVILQATLPDVAVREVVAMLSECYAELGLIIVAGSAGAPTRTGSVGSWLACGADEFLRLPEQLASLRARVTRVLGRVATTQSGRGSHMSAPMIARLRDQSPIELLGHLDSFIGRVPQWLAELHQALQSADSERATTSCEQLTAAAEYFGAHDLTALSRATSALVAADDLDHAASFVDAVEAEYHQVFGEAFRLMTDIRRTEKIL